MARFRITPGADWKGTGQACAGEGSLRRLCCCCCCRCSGCLLPDRKGGAAAPQSTCTRASPRRFETTALRLGAALCSQPDARRDRRPEDGEAWSETDSVPAGRSSCSAQRSADRRCGASCGSGRGGSGTLVLS